MQPSSHAFHRQAADIVQVRLMGASHDILQEVVTSERFQESEIAVVSRCDYPPWAVACMRLFEAAPGVTLADATRYTVHHVAHLCSASRTLFAYSNQCSKPVEDRRGICSM
jgi:hypothetical protein